jgi:hypothetical protein
MKTGQIMKLAPVHGVNTFLKNPRDRSNYNIMLLPIRMSRHKLQEEGFIIRCSKCNEIVYQSTFNVKEGPERKHYPEFYALRYYSQACAEFNSSEDKRTCPKCATVLPEFPLRQMGWWLYAENIEVANRGRDTLETLAQAALAPAEA